MPKTFSKINDKQKIHSSFQTKSSIKTTFYTVLLVYGVVETVIHIETLKCVSVTYPIDWRFLQLSWSMLSRRTQYENLLLI